jgi:hypothetical protein
MLAQGQIMSMVGLNFVIQQNLSPGHKVEEAWLMLHSDIPRLFEHATFNYRGNLQPGLTITAEVMREEIETSVNFEVKDNGSIMFPNSHIGNMFTRSEIHEHYSGIDPRIPPLSQYEETDDRPYIQHKPVNFYLNQGIPIDNRSDEGPGRLGGDNGTYIDLPGISYGKPSIDTTDPSNPKVQGALKGTPGDQGDSEDSCPTDSSSDTIGEEHRLTQIAQAIHRHEPVMVHIRGHFKGDKDEEAICEFRRPHVGPPPTSLKDLFKAAFREIADLAVFMQSTGIPGALYWTIVPLTDENISGTVQKIGVGISVIYERKRTPSHSMEDLPTKYALPLPGNWTIVFGAEEGASDAVLMQYLINITAPWDGRKYGKPWLTILVAQPWRRSDTGEVVLQLVDKYPEGVDWQNRNPRIPRNAINPCQGYEATSLKESGNLLKFGRNVEWPLFISVASTLDGTNSATVTYQAEWTDREDRIMWFMNQFEALLNADGLVGLPVCYRSNIPWQLKIRKENNSVRALLVERTPVGEPVSTPEDDGTPCFLPYGPRATIKMRCESVDKANQFRTQIYNRMPDITEELHTLEWAMIASIDGGSIPNKHRVSRDQEIVVENPAAWNKVIFDSGQFIKPYDKGFDRLVTKFKLGRPVSAIIAIEKGCRHDHGTSILFQQDTQRCLLTDTLYGLSDDEALWFTLQSWAKFQPRKLRPRSDPGQLYLPSAASHIFEKYWSHLNEPLSHPGSAQESEHVKDSMYEVAKGLSDMDLSQFTPLPDVESDEKSCRIATQAALSRRCPIQDAADYWNPPGSQGVAVTDLASPRQDGPSQC